MNNSPDFYIDNDKALKAVIKLILKAKTVALDTEFTRERTYYPILSLIQIAVKDGDKQRCFAVDCLADVNLKPLFKIIANKRITKILHSSLQDLQIFQGESKMKSAAISDTQIMANFCDLDFNVGYSGLVEHFFQKKIDKSQQRSNWQRRPLSQKQLEYALSDVVYLEEMHDKLMKTLEEKGRKKWYLEEVNNFSKNASVKLDESLFRVFSFRGKTPNEVVKIKKLILLREKWAKKLDVPRQHLIKNEALEDIVMSNVINLRLRSEMIDEIEKILDKNESSRTLRKFAPRSAFMTQRQKDIYSEAKKIVAKTASRENVKEQFLITSVALKSLILEHESVDKVLCKWRYQLFGKSLKKLIS